MPKRPQRKALPVAMAAALLGLGVGAAITHQWLMCPEYGYPKCYQRMVEGGFSELEGVQYTYDAKWRGDTLHLSFDSNITCPYWALVSVRVPSTNEEGRSILSEVYAEKIFFEEGKAPEVQVPELAVPVGEEVVVVLHGIPYGDLGIQADENVNSQAKPEAKKDTQVFRISDVISPTVFVHNKVFKVQALKE